MKHKILFIILFIGMTFTLGNAGVGSAKYAHDEKKTKALKEAGRAIIDFSDVYKNAKGKIKMKEFKNGDYYVGEWKKGKPHGYGKMVYANKSIYVGSWNFGQIQGFGVFSLPNGSKYSGNWLNNKYHGQGKVTLPNGDWYDGQWFLGKIEGNGKVYIRSNNANFEGTSKCLVLRNNLQFKPLCGKYSTPKKTLEGTWESESADSWDYGTFKGTYETDSLKFIGSMKGDSFVEGELIFKNTELGSHNGLYKYNRIYDGVSDGFIDWTYLCDKPAKYIGIWKNGTFTGKFEGKDYGPNTIRYKLSIDDRGIIFGIVQRTDGGVYFGLFKDKKLDGEGKLLYPDIEYKGLWKDGQWIEGTAEIQRDNQNPLKITCNGQQFLVEDPENRLTGVYSAQSFDYSSPIAEIENLYNKKRKEEQERKEKEERKKFVDFFDANYAGLVFEVDDIVSYVNEGYGMFGSMMGMEVGIVVSLRKGGIANIKPIINSSSGGFEGLLLGSLISGGGESMLLYPGKNPNVLMIDSDDKIIVANDKRSALLYLSDNKVIRLKRRF